MTSYITYLRRYIGHSPLIMCCAGVLILSPQEQILLQHRADNDSWGIPGGAMELGESLEDTARREVFEETGLTLGKLELLGVFSGKEFYYLYPNGDEVFIVDHIFISREFSGELKISKESKDLSFFAPNNLPANIHQPDCVILDYFSKKFHSKN